MLSSLLSDSISVMWWKLDLSWDTSNWYEKILALFWLKFKFQLLNCQSDRFFNFATLTFSNIISNWQMSHELLEYLGTRSRSGVSVKIFEGDDINKEDGSLFYAGEFMLSYGFTSN